MPPSEAGIQALAERIGFRTFGEASLLRAVEAVRDWQDSFLSHSAPRWLTLLGSNGVGKTYLAKYLWDLLVPECKWDRCVYSHYFVYWPALLNKLRNGECYAVRDDMQRWPLLALDDIGAERDPSGFAAETLNTLLGCRTGRWTIITSNLTMKQFADIDGRIASRLIRDKSIVVELKTKDYALRTEAEFQSRY